MREFTQTVKEGAPPELVKLVQKIVGVEQNGIFGPMTREHVQRWQKVHAIQPTGEVGPTTWAALFPKLDLNGVVVRIAKSYDGVHEQGGPNRGPLVDKWNLASGAGLGGHWCLSYVYAVCLEAAKELKQPCAIPKSAYCPFLLNWARANGRLTSDPRPGDIFLLKGEGTAIHTGFFLGWSSDGHALTIEGNTNDDGSSNGYKVCQRKRRRETLYFVSLD